MHTSPTSAKSSKGSRPPRDVPHVQPPSRRSGHGRGRGRHLFAGEWFEIAEAEHDYMLEILPPLCMRADMFAMREYMTASITSVLFNLSIDGFVRFFHGYCDLADHASPGCTCRDHRSKVTPVRAMTRERARAYLVNGHGLPRPCRRALPAACGQAHGAGLLRKGSHYQAARRAHR